MRQLNEIIIHCSATQPNWAHGKGVEWIVGEFRRWHKARGWSDIGYHYVVGRGGSIATGRPLEKTGAHVKGHNTGTVGICLVGGHGASADDEFSDHFTQAQDKALRQFVADMRRKYPAIQRVSGHNEYANKGCPGFSVSAWYAPPEPPKADWVAGVPKKPQSPWAGIFAAFFNLFRKERR